MIITLLIHTLKINTPFVLDFLFSGLLYGLFLMEITLSIALRFVFKYKKRSVIVYLQLLVVLIFLLLDILGHLQHSTLLIKELLDRYLLFSFVLLVLLQSSIYANFSLKRELVQHKHVLLKATTGIAILLYLLNPYPLKPVIPIFLTIIALGFIQLLIFKQKLHNKTPFNLILITILTTLYSLCTLSDSSSLDLNYFNIISLKILYTILMLLSLLLSFQFLKQLEKQRLKDKIKQIQLALITKSYHKLFLEQKQLYLQDQTNKQQECRQEQLTFVCETLKTKYDITDRELEIIQLIWTGKTNKEIADSLFISLSTIKYHINSIFVKLNIRSRSQIFVLKDSMN